MTGVELLYGSKQNKKTTKICLKIKTKFINGFIFAELFCFFLYISLFNQNFHKSKADSQEKTMNVHNKKVNFSAAIRVQLKVLSFQPLLTVTNWKHASYPWGLVAAEEDFCPAGCCLSHVTGEGSARLEVKLSRDQRVPLVSVVSVLSPSLRENMPDSSHPVTFILQVRVRSDL